MGCAPSSRARRLDQQNHPGNYNNTSSIEKKKNNRHHTESKLGKSSFNEIKEIDMQPLEENHQKLVMNNVNFDLKQHFYPMS